MKEGPHHIRLPPLRVPLMMATRRRRRALPSSRCSRRDAGREHIERADVDPGTSTQFLFLVRSPRCMVRNTECDVHADRQRVLDVVVARLEARAIRVRLTGAGQRRLDGLAGRGHDLHVEVRDRNFVTGLATVCGPGDELRIDLGQNSSGRAPAAGRPWSMKCLIGMRLRAPPMPRSGRHASG